MFMSSWSYELPMWGAAAYFLFLLVVSFGLGLFFGRKRQKNNPNLKETSFYIEATLLSLLIGFTFSLAAGKYDKRKAVFVEEINAISTVHMRIGMYPDRISDSFKTLLLQYVDQRINYYEAGSNESAVAESLKLSEALSRKIFDLASSHGADAQFLAQTQQLVPALNTMFDLATSREIYRLDNIPMGIIRLLVVISIIVIFLIGYNHTEANINIVAVGGYMLLILFSFILILDMGNSRLGNIRFPNEQTKLIELRKSMS
jgi:energy-converting hydrogenase Eha subunit E